MSDIELDYDFLTQNALRQVMIDVLKITADLGEAPGEHHFYIEFLTEAPGVLIPDHLKEAYPERMTIVLQHQFENLRLGEQGFSVTLSFKGKEADLTIPYETITSFADPSVQFGLRFETEEDQKAPPKPASQQDGDAPAKPQQEAADEETADDASKDTGDVVSLDAFRKK